MLSAPDITARFLSEQRYIQRYVEFLHEASSIRDSDMSSIRNTLERHGLPQVPGRSDWRRWREPYSAAELSSAVSTLHRSLPQIDAKITEYEQRLAQLSKPKGLNEVDARSHLGEWIEFMKGALAYDSSPEAIQAARRDALQQEDRVAREMGEAAEQMPPDGIDYAIQSALLINAGERLSDLVYVRDRYADFELAARMTRPEAEINILRQGFILLMTAFDAAVFDLVRVALSRDFFGLISVFGRQERISLETFARYNGFEALRDDVIESQLKTRYLKDLLFLLDNLGVQCVAEPNGRFVELVELVMRRNVHVHNRGIVDERYLERDQQGTARFNIYNLAPGSAAQIDEEYWERANTLCRHCVESVAAWANSRGSAPTPGQ